MVVGEINLEYVQKIGKEKKMKEKKNKEYSYNHSLGSTVCLMVPSTFEEIRVQRECY